MRDHKHIREWAERCARGLRTVSSLLCPLIAIAFVPTASATVAAQDTIKLDPLGGPGGNYFEQICRPGRVLVGVQGWGGVWIDSVQAVCAKFDINGVSDAQSEGRVFGGAGGEHPISAKCSNGQVVGYAEVSSTNDSSFVGSISLKCLNSSRNVADATVMRGTGRTDQDLGGDGFHGFRGDQQCPPSTVAVGILGRAGKFVDAFGLICSVRPMPLQPGTANLLGREVSFESVNFPERYIRHRNSLGFIEPISDSLAKQDATFKIVPGLAGKCFSFESHNYPNQFLRHQGSRLKLAALANDQLFQQDATFCITTGLASSEGASFESVNYPAHYLRHRNFELWLDRFEDSEQFRKDGTFQIRPPAAANSAARAFGKIKLPNTRPRETPSSPAPGPTPPFITANPETVVISPRRDQGTTTLIWDAGPDHPSAQVWVKINDADESFIVEQSKGSRGFMVDPGNTYLFILTDAGQRLATVTVTVKQ